MGALGALLFLFSDFIMIYGDPTPLSNKVGTLTVGISQVPAWKNNLAMAIGFIAIFPYSVGLFSLENLITNKTKKTIYHYLNIIGLTQWLLLHFIFIALFYAFHFMMTEGYKDVAVPISEALFHHFIWIIPVCLILMAPSFAYYLWLTIRGHTLLNKYMGLLHMAVFMIVLSVIKMFLPESSFKIGFSNALSNISILLYFICLIIYFAFSSKNTKKDNK